MNMMDKPKRPAPPKPLPRKGSPINAEYEEKAKRVIREALAESGLTIEQLTDALADLGVELSPGGVANKISRGGFSAAFLLQCLDAAQGSSAKKQGGLNLGSRKCR